MYPKKEQRGAERYISKLQQVALLPEKKYLRLTSWPLTVLIWRRGRGCRAKPCSHLQEEEEERCRGDRAAVCVWVVKASRTTFWPKYCHVLFLDLLSTSIEASGQQDEEQIENGSLRQRSCSISKPGTYICRTDLSRNE